MCVGRTNGRSHSFVLDFSFVSFLCIKTKKRKELKNILYWLEERRNSMDNCMLQVKLSTRAENKRIFNFIKNQKIPMSHKRSMHHFAKVASLAILTSFFIQTLYAQQAKTKPHNPVIEGWYADPEG